MNDFGNFTPDPQTWSVLQHPYCLRDAEPVPLFHSPLISDCVPNLHTAKRLRLALVGYSVYCCPHLPRYQRPQILFTVTVSARLLQTTIHCVKVGNVPRLQWAVLSMYGGGRLVCPSAAKLLYYGLRRAARRACCFNLRPIGTRRYMQSVGYPVTRRGRLQMSPYCPRLRPWAGGLLEPAGGGLLGFLGGFLYLTSLGAGLFIGFALGGFLGGFLGLNTGGVDAGNGFRNKLSNIHCASDAFCALDVVNRD